MNRKTAQQMQYNIDKASRTPMKLSKLPQQIMQKIEEEKTIALKSETYEAGVRPQQERRFH